MQYNSHEYGYLVEDLDVGWSKIPKDFCLRLFYYDDSYYQIVWCGNILNLDKSLFIIYDQVPVTYMSVASD